MIPNKFTNSIIRQPRLEKNVLILESAMPSAMMSLVFAVLYGLDVKLVASACFITTVVSLVVLPIIHSML